MTRNQLIALGIGGALVAQSVGAKPATPVSPLAPLVASQPKAAAKADLSSLGEYCTALADFIAIDGQRATRLMDDAADVDRLRRGAYPACFWDSTSRSVVSLEQRYPELVKALAQPLDAIGAKPADRLDEAGLRGRYEATWRQLGDAANNAAKGL